MKSLFSCAFMAASLATAATASPDTDAWTVAVPYSAADFASPASRAKLDARVRQAIRKECDVTGFAPIEAKSDRIACEERAWRLAAGQIETAFANQQPARDSGFGR